MTAVALLTTWALLLQTVELWSLRREVAPVWGWWVLARPVLAAQAVAALGLCFDRRWALVALLTTIWIGWGFRGTFNGGSDNMTVVVLCALLWPAGGRLYLAVQLCLSYFVAGVVKLRQPSWWDGTALRAFLGPGWPAWVGWGVIVWECLFPLALVSRGFAGGFCAVGVAFHLANCRLLGLNRFLWIWLAAYPALLSG